jgi:hypothetical protein
MPSLLAKPFALSAAITIALASAAVVPSCIQRPAVPSDPETSNQFVEQIRYQSVDKIDLLFVVDNSVSMSDKQRALKEAVPGMLRRLVNPPCVDDAGQREPAQEGVEVPCRAGFEREFQPVEDIHIGVISSSLGDHGGDVCPDGAPRQDDRALLVPKVRDGLTSWNGSGFLLWDPRGKYTPAGYGAGQADAMIKAFGETIEAVKDDGCGYESTLEAWYRFLVDPEPPVGVQTDRQGPGVPVGLDQDVLDQRKAFLRPDSLVVIVTLTDEDDCSIRDDQYGWLLGAEDRDRPRATSACAADPLSVCCRPCTSVEATPPAGCEAVATDPACATPTYTKLPNSSKRPGDDANLRCFDQKGRYGMDFLYPTSRYVRALTESEIPNRAGTLVPNPLFRVEGANFVRDKSMILYAGIVGVPWQDAATAASLEGPGLEYLNAKELALEGRFELFLGDPKNSDPTKRAPKDPLMVASPNPRSGVHPLTGEAVAPSTSQNPRENRINGHESVNVDDGDLQYACIFPLSPPIESCTGGGCDCSDKDLPRNSALCQPPTGGAATTTQYFAKAYPGLRHLEVLSGIGNAAVVASICPKVTTAPVEDPSYGYNPALEALTDIIIDRFELCLPRALDVAPDGELPCRVAEALPSEACDCAALPGRTAPSPELDKAVKDELAKSGHCGGDSGKKCSDFCVCALSQASGPSLTSCQNDKTADVETPGYCYIDGEREDDSGQPAPIGNTELVANCPAGSQRKLRFVGRDTPQNGAVTFIACMGAAL